MTNRSRSFALSLCLAAVACALPAHAQSDTDDSALFRQVEGRLLSASKNCAQPSKAQWTNAAQAKAYVKASTAFDACLGRIATRTANLDVPKFIQKELAAKTPREKGQVLLAFTTIQENVVSALYTQRLAVQENRARAEKFALAGTSSSDTVVAAAAQ